MLDFSHDAAQLPLKTSCFQQISDFHFITSVTCMRFFALGEVNLTFTWLFECYLFCGGGGIFSEN
jgi:hypothetical protein